MAGKLWKFEWANITPPAGSLPACNYRILIESYNGPLVVESLLYVLHVHTTTTGPLPCPANEVTRAATPAVTPPFEILHPQDGSEIHARPLLFVHVRAPENYHPLRAVLNPYVMFKGQHLSDGPPLLGFPLSVDPLGPVHVFRLPVRAYEWYGQIVVTSLYNGRQEIVYVKVLAAP